MKRIVTLAGFGAAALLLAAGTATATEDCLQHYLDLPALKELAAAKSVTSLRARFRQMPYHDKAADVVFATRLYDLSASKEAETLLLAAIPKSPLEFSYLYRLTWPGADGFIDPTLNNIFDQFYRRAEEVVQRRTSELRSFLVLNRFADGVLLDMVQELSARLLAADRAAFLRVFKTLDQTTRDKFCAGRSEAFCHEQPTAPRE